MSNPPDKKPASRLRQRQLLAAPGRPADQFPRLTQPPVPHRRVQRSIAHPDLGESSTAGRCTPFAPPRRGLGGKIVNSPAPTPLMGVVMSLAKMASVDYLVGHVAVGDGRAGDVGASPLTRYYTAEGYPPGTWLGSGMATLGAAGMSGSEVTEEQLRALFEDARN